MSGKALNFNISSKWDYIKKNPALVLTLGFFILILTGGFILTFGIFSRTGQRTPFVDAVFVAGSASCVTGLTTVNTAQHWNTGGHLVILVLIQIGGLGIMTAATLLPLLLGQKIGLKSRRILSEQYNVDSFAGIVRLFKYTLSFTFIVEAIGAGLLALSFVPAYGIKTGLWYSVFHSISAFCNAGFDIIGDSIVPFKSDPIVNLTIMGLIIVGGLGFMVTLEILKKKNFSKLSVHAKLVILVTIILIIAGTLGFLILEYTNEGTIAQENFITKVFQSSFQSVVARTAGFYSVNLANLRDQTALLLIILMFIGGSPGSTAGGIKTTTFGILVLSTIAVIKGKKEPLIFNKHISLNTITTALAITMIYLTAVLGVVFAVSIIEPAPFIDILYEIVSAFATVGASKGMTPDLQSLSKVLITISMYAGRVGPLTLAYALTTRDKESKIRFPGANIRIG